MTGRQFDSTDRTPSQASEAADDQPGSGPVPAKPQQPAPRMLTRVCVGLAVVLFIGLFLSRSFAQRFDFGVANILTLIMGFLAWLSLTIGLAASNLRRWVWRSVALAPLVVVAVALSFLRVVRVDGELVPQFESRWKSAALPPAGPEAGEQEGIPAEMLQPRATDFPQFLGPHRNGIVTGTKLETDWKSHPPEILWKQPIGAAWSSFAVQGDVAVTLEQREDQQWISAYEVETGRLLWHTAIPGSHFNVMGGTGPRSTPTLVDGRVYAHLAAGQLVCLELATGKKIWEVDLLKLANWDQSAAEVEVSWGRSGSPLVVGHRVIVPLGGPEGERDRSLIALSIEDGHMLWRAGSDQMSYSSPALVTLLGKQQIVMVNETSVTGHELDSGAVLWSVPWPGQSNGSANVSQPVPLDDSRLLISKGYSHGSEVVQFSKDSDSGWKFDVVWRDSGTLKTKFTSPVVRGAYAYGLSDGILECVRLSDGKRQWKKGRYRQGQVLLVDDVLLVTSESGSIVLVAAEPEEFRELAKLDVIGDVTWNVPALSGDRLLIRNADEAACLRLPLAEGKADTQAVDQSQTQVPPNTLRSEPPQ